MNKENMQFKNLEEFYVFAENKVFRSRSDYDLGLLLKKIHETEQDDIVKRNLQNEIYFFDFAMIDGKVESHSSSTTEDGITLWEYPSYDFLDEAAFQYLIWRSKRTKNDFLIARYNQILWNAPFPYKHSKYAKKACDAYLRLLKSIVENSKVKKNEDFNLYDLLRNGLNLSTLINYKLPTYKECIKEILFKKGRIDDDLKVLVIKLMLEFSKIKKIDFENVPELIVKLARKKRTSKGIYEFQRLYESGLLIAQRFRTDLKVWYRRLGDAAVYAAENRMDDDTKMVPLSYYKEALGFYKLAGAVAKIKKTELLYTDLRRNLKLSKIEIPLNEEHSNYLNTYLNKKTDALLSASSQEIYGYLTSSEDIIPKAQTAAEFAKDSDSFMDHFTTVKFDINNNLTRMTAKRTEAIEFKIYQNYDIYLRLYVMPFLFKLFVNGIKQQKLTFSNLANFLKKETWLGRDLIGSDASENENIYSWLALIAPSLHDYFYYTESAIKSNRISPNYILAIDSLTLKFEGALRDFATFIGVSPTQLGKKDVLREKYIEELLIEKKMKDYFSETDLFFFKFLFVAKNGMNLRNNIAHAFFKPKNYSMHHMHLLIFAFMRLGKYKITYTTSNK